MIEFVNVGKSYDKKIIENLSFKIKQGENFGFFGKSGIGKTTIINMILGFAKPDSGEIYNDYKRISVVFQENRLVDEISAIDNLKMLTNDKNLVIDVLEKFAIKDYKKIVKKLSGGTQRRLALARAFLYKGEILVLDEPFTGIDDTNKAKIIKLFKEEFMNKSIILVSHNKDDFKAFEICDKNTIFL